MNLLFIGDIVGAPGRRAVRTLLPALRARHDLHLVIANGENSAGGAGITPDTASEIFAAGVDIITTGDHLWDQKEVNELLLRETRFLRPLNYPAGTLGQGSTVWQRDGLPSVGILNAQGRTFMPPLDNPFTAVPPEVERVRRHTPLIFVDFHAEATSEKIAFARMLDGKVSAVVGTHTHVQTADEKILKGGTAYLTDAGMTGPKDSIIGCETEPIIKRFLTGLPVRFQPAEAMVTLEGALIEMNADGRAVSIQRVQIPDHGG